MTAKLPNNTTREHWDTHTHGRHQNGERHCFTRKFQVAVTIWTGKAQRRTAWRVLNELKGPNGDGWILMDTSLAVTTRSGERWSVFGDYPGVFAVEDCNYGCVETSGKKPDDWEIPPIPTSEKTGRSCPRSNSPVRRRHHSKLLARLSKRLGPRPNAVTKPAMCAGKRQHGRRKNEQRETETTVCSFCREVTATLTAICEEGNHVVRDESCLHRGATAFTNGSGPREARGAQERTLESFTLFTVSRRVRERPRRGDSYLHATFVILCRRNGRTLAV